MEMSADITLLAVALAKAQGQMEGAVKNSSNPFFKSKYPDLASVWDACRKPLTENGLSVVQCPSTDVVEDRLRVSVETILLHSSGQWIKGILTVEAKENSPQAAGSCVSYARRYALQSFAGVAPEDDDAEAAQGRGTTKVQQIAEQVARVTPAPVPLGFQDWLTDLEAIALEGTGKLEKTWKGSKTEYRQYLTAMHPAHWAQIKASAAKAVLTSEMPA